MHEQEQQGHIEQKKLFIKGEHLREIEGLAPDVVHVYKEKVNNISETSNAWLETLKNILPPVSKSFAGHGTVTAETAASILEDGIFMSKHFELTETVVPLSKDVQKLQLAVENWKHKFAQYIVILEIPDSYKPYDIMERGSYKKFHSGEMSHIPSRFVKGYLDIAKKTFIPNSRFEANPAKTGYTEQWKQQQEANLLDRRNNKTAPPQVVGNEETDLDVW